MFLRPSAIALVLANLAPLAGVLLLNWQVIDILVLYWAENVIIGVVNVLRMSVTRSAKKWFLMPFFAAHYGLFCFGHLAAISAIFGESMSGGTAWQYFFATPFALAWKSPLWIAIAAIAASHLFSFFTNFVAGDEYRRTNVRQLMQRPYGRIIVLHVAIIVGGALIQWLGSPVMMLVALVAAKIALDLRLHVAERDIFAAESATT